MVNTELIEISFTEQVTDGQTASLSFTPEFVKDGSIYVEYLEISTNELNFYNTRTKDYSNTSCNVSGSIQTPLGNEITNFGFDGFSLREERPGSKAFSGIESLNRYIQEGKDVIFELSSSGDHFEFDGDQTVSLDVSLIGRRVI